MHQNDPFNLPTALLEKLLDQRSDREQYAGFISAESRAMCGAWVSKIRVRKGLSIAQVAEQIEVAAPTLLLLEAGLAEQELSGQQIIALANVLSDTQLPANVISTLIRTALGQPNLQYNRLLSDAIASVANTAEPATSIKGELNVAADDKLALLRSVPLFARLNDAALEALALQLSVEQFAPGDIIVKQNSIGKTMYIIVSGEVRIYMTSVKGRELPVRKLGAGGFFGEMALLDGQVRSASVQAEQPTITLTLHSREFWSVVMPDPTISVMIILELSRRLRELLLYTTYLAEIIPPTKVAETLAEFARRRNSPSRDMQLGQWEVMAHLSQNEADAPSNERTVLMQLLEIFQSVATG
jgi:CRP/FNR family transcriptional regulator